MNEVVLSVQFQSEVVDELGALTRFRPAIERDFPGLDKQPPLPPAAEDFARPSTAGMQVQFMQGPPTMRYWFTSPDGSSLLQVQADRFILNWRDVPGGRPYPRYRTLRPEFEERYGQFCAQLADPEPDVAWCEITYVNHIEAAEGAGGAHGPLSRVLRSLSAEPVSPTLPPVEDTHLQQRFVIADESNGSPMGRLYLSATPAWRVTDGFPIYVLTLLARGKPRAQGVDEILAFFDRGRDLIVNGFVESTREELHETWGLHPR